VSQGSAPTIVAIIPLYNGARFIEQSLRSVLGQTTPADEIIVVDDGSEDDGPARAIAIADGRPGFRLVRQPNGGQSSARNRGVRESGSSLLAFLDQDDIWYPRHLERLVQPFEGASVHRLGWTYSNVDEIDHAGRLVVRSLLDPAHHPKKSLYQCLREDMFVLPASSLVSRVAFEEVGGFDEQLKGYEDDDFFLRAFRAGHANVFVDEALSMWRIHTASTSYSRHMSVSRLRYARKLIAEFPDVPERHQYIVRDLIAPRFVGGFLNDIYDAARFGRPEQLKMAGHALRELVPHLRPGQRIQLATALPILTNYQALRLLVRVGLLDVARTLLSRLRRQSGPRSAPRK
jgi:glycosyltransferase involved in cell wall biosynthesis